MGSDLVAAMERLGRDTQETAEQAVEKSRSAVGKAEGQVEAASGQLGQACQQGKGKAQATATGGQMGQAAGKAEGQAQAAGGQLKQATHQGKDKAREALQAGKEQAGQTATTALKTAEQVGSDVAEKGKCTMGQAESQAEAASEKVTDVTQQTQEQAREDSHGVGEKLWQAAAAARDTTEQGVRGAAGMAGTALGKMGSQLEAGREAIGETVVHTYHRAADIVHDGTHAVGDRLWNAASAALELTGLSGGTGTAKTTQETTIPSEEPMEVQRGAEESRAVASPAQKTA
eukprot:GGOE01040482.1.p1 GENE.GGOE01040482.1~~GGOE01040482.1.p1  ORF type:complete len:311 (+),score=76.52 GGOE01040482.1:72-935(+)